VRNLYPRGLAATFVAVGFFPADAHAEQHKVCLSYNLGNDFYDASARPISGDDADEDYGRRTVKGVEPTELVVRAPASMLVRVEDAGGTLWGWRSVGGDGCTGTFDTDETMLVVEWINWAHWGAANNNIVALECDLNDCGVDRGSILLDNFASNVETIDAAPFVGTDELFIFWALSDIEERGNFMSNHTTYAAYMGNGNPEFDEYPGAMAADIIGGNPTMLFKGYAYKYKYTIAHEYGHVVTMWPVMSELVGASADVYCYDTPMADDCQHVWDSLEHQGAAFVEGMANFFSYAVWNDPGVGFEPLASAYSGFDEIRATNDVPNSFYLSAPTTAYAYCDGVPNCLPGVAVERDWAYFLWDLTMGGSPLLSMQATLGLVVGVWSSPGPWIHGQVYADLEGVVSNYLSPSELMVFQDMAAARGVDN
jgi:hypothetical protein